MLRKTRKIAAAALFILLTLLFLDFTGTLHFWFGLLAKIQIIPAILSVNLMIIIGLVLLTFLFGRIYCSVICPLGILQDGISNVAGRRKGKKNRFVYSAAKSWLRYGVLGLFILALILGIGAVVSILDPYAAFGRIASNFFSPIYRWGNNLLAWFAERADSYAFYSTEVRIKGWITFGIAAITFLIVGILAWRSGRTYCNTICPVGTILGILSKISVFKPTFNAEKCTKCKACERGCKSSCIDATTMKIDYSRCVTCFNCIDRCRVGAIKYAPVKVGKKIRTDSTDNEQGGLTRRNMLTLLGTMALTATVKAQQLYVDGGLAVIENKKIPNRKTPIVPPGAESAQNMKKRCTACQLCVSACPNNVLRPSNKPATFMQPEMSFEKGYCRPECVECSQVCPTSAIKPITTAEKSALSIGKAVWIAENCVVIGDEIQCHSCEQRCPAKAIMLIERDPNDGDSLKIPVIDKELCIGCGACEFHCPARPFSAIYIEGNVRHHSI